MIRQDSLPQQLLRFAPKHFYALGCSAYLFTAGIFSARHREFVWKMCRHFGWPDNRTASLLPKTRLDSFFEEAGPLEVLAPQAINGNISELELLAINLFVKRAQPSRIFEIGTFDGRTSLNMIANAPEAAQLFTLDLPPEQLSATALAVDKADVAMILKESSGGRFHGTAYASRITQLYGDSASFNFSPYERTIDLVFVDGSHAYDYVKNDAEVALRLLRKSGGLILFHDYDAVWDGVTRALNELAVSHSAMTSLRHLAGTSLAFLSIDARDEPPPSIHEPLPGNPLP